MSEQTQFDPDEAERLIAAATPGPWKVEQCGTDCYPQRVIAVGKPILVCETYTGPEYPPQNAEFIAYARTALPAAVSLVREQAKRIKALSEYEGLPTPASQYVHAIETIATLRKQVKAFREVYADVAQLFDGWHTDIAWSAWDEQVRQRLVKAIQLAEQEESPDA